MFKKVIFILFAFLSQSAFAENHVAFQFASMQQGQQLLMVRDEYIQNLSPFERSAKLKVGIDVSEEAFMRGVADEVRDWSAEEKKLTEAAIRRIHRKIDPLHLPLPDPITLIKTTGNEEGGAPYTRGTAIVIPNVELTKNDQDSLSRVIAHELFHIFTRKNTALRDKLYESIGFYNCGELTFPSKLKPIKITNPDAPTSEPCIRITIAGAKKWAVPILFSSTNKFDTSSRSEFFDFLRFRLLIVDGDSATPPTRISYDDANLQLFEHTNVDGFFEQVGQNTDYVIHPEEILADSFAMMIMGDADIPSPKVISRMRAILSRSH